MMMRTIMQMMTIIMIGTTMVMTINEDIFYMIMTMIIMMKR
jgi:hypothetical protein